MNAPGTRYTLTQKALDDPSFLIMLVGPEEAAKHVRDLTPGEQVLVDEYVARHDGSHAAALGVTDPDLAADIDALFVRGGAR